MDQPCGIQVEQVDGGGAERLAHSVGIARLDERRQMAGQRTELGGRASELHMVDVRSRSIRCHDVAG
jgi:hypothetical protein